MSIFGRNAFGMTDLLAENGPGMDLLNDANAEDGSGVDIAAQSDDEGSAEEEQATTPILSVPIATQALQMRVPPQVLTIAAKRLGATTTPWYQKPAYQIAAVAVASVAVLGIGAAVAMHATKAKANCGWR